MLKVLMIVKEIEPGSLCIKHKDKDLQVHEEDFVEL